MADEAGLDFSEIVREHRVALEGRALWLTKSESDAADLFQETLEHALRGPRRALSPEVVRRWLYTIMYNVFLDRWRAQAVRRTVVFDRRLEEQVATRSRRRLRDLLAAAIRNRSDTSGIN